MTQTDGVELKTAAHPDLRPWWKRWLQALIPPPRGYLSEESIERICIDISKSGRRIRLVANDTKIKDYMQLLVNGCNRGCDYDEAEGALIEHCPTCCRNLTAMAHELFVEQKRVIGRKGEKHDSSGG